MTSRASSAGCSENAISVNRLIFLLSHSCQRSSKRTSQSILAVSRYLAIPWVAMVLWFVSWRIPACSSQCRPLRPSPTCRCRLGVRKPLQLTLGQTLTPGRSTMPRSLCVDRKERLQKFLRFWLTKERRMNGIKAIQSTWCRRTLFKQPKKQVSLSSSAYKKDMDITISLLALLSKITLSIMQKSWQSEERTPCCSAWISWFTKNAHGKIPMKNIHCECGNLSWILWSMCLRRFLLAAFVIHKILQDKSVIISKLNLLIKGRALTIRKAAPRSVALALRWRSTGKVIPKLSGCDGESEANAVVVFVIKPILFFLSSVSIWKGNTQLSLLMMTENVDAYVKFRICSTAWRDTTSAFQP